MDVYVRNCLEVQMQDPEPMSSEFAQLARAITAVSIGLGVPHSDLKPTITKLRDWIDLKSQNINAGKDEKLSKKQVSNLIDTLYLRLKETGINIDLIRREPIRRFYITISGPGLAEMFTTDLAPSLSGRAIARFELLENTIIKMSGSTTNAQPVVKMLEEYTLSAKPETDRYL